LLVTLAGRRGGLGGKGAKVGWGRRGEKTVKEKGIVQLIVVD
jgi:hypothetical protein